MCSFFAGWSLQGRDECLSPAAYTGAFFSVSISLVVTALCSGPCKHVQTLAGFNVQQKHKVSLSCKSPWPCAGTSLQWFVKGWEYRVHRVRFMLEGARLRCMSKMFGNRCSFLVCGTSIRGIWRGWQASGDGFCELPLASLRDQGPHSIAPEDSCFELQLHRRCITKYKFDEMSIQDKQDIDAKSI